MKKLTSICIGLPSVVSQNIFTGGTARGLAREWLQSAIHTFK
jgi:hypothetical protein